MATEDIATEIFDDNSTSFGSMITSIQARLPTYTNLTNLDCIKAYSSVFVSSRGTLVMITNATTNHITARQTFPTGVGTVPYAYANDNNTYGSSIRFHLNYSVNLGGTYNPYQWICSDPNFNSVYGLEPSQRNLSVVSNTCEPWISEVTDKPQEWSPHGYRVEHCLSEPMPEVCTYNANLATMMVIIASNAVKVLAMFGVLYTTRVKPLLVIGDAIESFLDKPDPSTKHSGLLSMKRVINGQDWRSTKHQVVPAYYTGPKNRARWYEAASRRRWLATGSFYAVVIAFIAAVIGYGIEALPERTWSRIRSIGLGKIQPDTLLTSVTSAGITNAQIMIAASSANLPQLILSLLYFSTNGLITSMLLTKEWSEFAVKRRQLRVSRPKGCQRSTYFLQLPFKIAIPLTIMTGSLHWLTSQAIFIAVVVVYTVPEQPSFSQLLVTTGYAPLPMIYILVVAISAVATLIWTGSHWYNPGIPLVGSCSAAISASCHASSSDINPAMKPLQWGAVVETRYGASFSHCCFTSLPITSPVHGTRYSNTPNNLDDESQTFLND